MYDHTETISHRKVREAGSRQDRGEAALVAKVGSLLDSNKLNAEREELQQHISTLENQNKENWYDTSRQWSKSIRKNVPCSMSMWTKYSVTSPMWRSCCR